MRQSTSAASNWAIQVRLKTDLASAIENFRRGEPDIPTRPEAIRRILQRALGSGLDGPEHRRMPTKDGYDSRTANADLEFKQETSSIT
jgi:hypothetical protein